MKITKAQIQKMIKEELEELEEVSYAPGGFKGYNLPDEEKYDAKADAERTDARALAAMQKMHDEFDQQKAARRAAEAQLRIDAAKAKDDRIYDYSNVKTLMDYLAKPYRQQTTSAKYQYTPDSFIKPIQAVAGAISDGILHINGQTVFELTPDKRIKIAKKLNTAVRESANSSYDVPEKQERRAGDLSKYRDNIIQAEKKAAYEAISSFKTNAEEEKEQLAAVGSAHAGQRKAMGDQRNFFQKGYDKLKGYFGLEEDLTLTSEDLQEIIRQEYENVTKGK